MCGVTVINRKQKKDLLGMFNLEETVVVVVEETVVVGYNGSCWY